MSTGKFAIALSCFVLLFTFVASDTIYQVLEKQPEFSQLVAALNTTAFASVAARLKGNDNTTFFAPTNAALNASTMNLTVDVLNYHLVGAIVPELMDGALLTTLYMPSTLGNNTAQRAAVTVANNVTKINGATVNTTQTFTADNGKIYTMQAVILAPAKDLAQLVAANDQLSTLQAQLTKVGIDLATFTGITAFGPVNEAFTAFATNNKVIFDYLQANTTGSKADLTKVLKYHVSPSLFYVFDLKKGTESLPTAEGTDITITTTENGTTVNKANFVATNVLATNGVAHAIDQVLVPSDFQMTLEKFAVGLGLNKFLEAITTAGLIDYLSGADNYTVFAPRDDAFHGNVTKEQLLYHIVKGSHTTPTLTDGVLLPSMDVLPTLGDQGQRLKFTTTDTTTTAAAATTVMVNGNKIVQADIMAHNGVLQVIDAVLVPPPDLVKVLSGDDTFSTLYKFVNSSAEVSQLLTAGNVTLFAPTDDAFAALPTPIAGYLTLPNMTDAVATVLKYHVVASVVYSAHLANNTYTTADAKLNVTVESVNGTIRVNGLEVVKRDILASTGVSHGIAGVLLPANLHIDTYGLLEGLHAETFLELLNQTKLLDALEAGNVTVFAPSDKAFADLKDQAILNANKSKAALTRLLQNHVVPQFVGELKVNMTLPTLNNDSSIIVTQKDNEWFIKLANNTHPAVKVFLPESSATVNSDVPKSFVYSLHGVLGEDAKKSDDDSGSGGLSSTVIGLIVAGCIVGVLLVGAAIGGGVWYYKKRHGYEQIEGDTF